MQFDCAECGFSRSVSEKYRGRKAKCPECKAVVLIGSEANGEFSNGKIDSSDFEIAVAASNERRDEMAAAESFFSSSSAAQSEIAEYSVSLNPLGNSVNYGCVACGKRLTSPLNDAGGQDHCPGCGHIFIVPGEKELEREQSKQASQLAARKAENDKRTEATKKAVVTRVAQKGLKNNELQLDRDPFREWLVYFFVVTVLFAFAAGRYMWSAIQTDSSYLCIVIFALFLVALVVNYRSILSLRNEYVCAAVCMINLKRPQGFQAVTEGPAAGVFHQHIVDLSRIARHDANVSQDSLITLLYSRMMARAKIVDVISGVLVTLGLIGTIVGLIAMTDGLSSTLASLGEDGDKGNAGNLLGGMRSTMSGLGTAFNTTLVGAVLGSVVLRILNNVYTTNVDRLVSYVAATAEVSIVPRLRHNAAKDSSQ